MTLDGITNGAAHGGALVATPLQIEQQAGRTPQQPAAAPGYLVTISPQAKSLSAADPKHGPDSSVGVSSGNETTGPQECQTCRNRKYVDRSNDPGVSFQSPTSVSPAAAEGAVRAHEQEHVSHEQAKAAEQDRRVVFQAVSIQYGICPECGRSFVAGGTTTTVTRAEAQPGAIIDGSPRDSASGGSVDLMV